MNKEIFVQNIKSFCARRNVKPTVACREAGVGTSFINNIEARGQVPSVEKVQLLAQYLGVTVSDLLGETSNPQTLADLTDLPADALDVARAYAGASEDDRLIVATALKKYGV